MEGVATPTPAAPRVRCIARLRLPRAWTPEEDARLERLAKENYFRHWHRVARQMEGRSPKLCLNRWRDHLARDVYHRPFTARDDAELARLHRRFGAHRWNDISRAVDGRTSRVMKRRWKAIRKSSGAPAPTKMERAAYCPSDDDETMESEPESEPPSPELRQQPFADVLASSFGSFSLASGGWTDPRAGSLALGFACMAV